MSVQNIIAYTLLHIFNRKIFVGSIALKFRPYIRGTLGANSIDSIESR